MCKETLKIVANMNREEIEKKIALQCAPLITGIKISNLLIVSSKEAESVPYILRRTGIVFFRLAKMEDRITFLVFRREELAHYLQDSDVMHILGCLGYRDLSLRGILMTFAKRYQTYANVGAGFPHEMGLLLGYPVEDVEGFIKHKGQNFLYSGYWKVYKDVPAKKRLFQSFENSQKDVVSLLADGVDIWRIIQLYQKANKPQIAV